MHRGVGIGVVVWMSACSSFVGVEQPIEGDTDVADEGSTAGGPIEQEPATSTTEGASGGGGTTGTTEPNPAEESETESDDAVTTGGTEESSSGDETTGGSARDDEGGEDDDGEDDGDDDSADPEPVTCADLVLPEAAPSVCSVNSASVASLQISNNCTAISVDVYWVGYPSAGDVCGEQFFQRLEPGTGTSFGSFETHPWRIRNASNNALMREIPPLSGDTIVNVLEP